MVNPQGGSDFFVEGIMGRAAAKDLIDRFDGADFELTADQSIEFCVAWVRTWVPMMIGTPFENALLAGLGLQAIVSDDGSFDIKRS